MCVSCAISRLEGEEIPSCEKKWKSVKNSWKVQNWSGSTELEIEGHIQRPSKKQGPPEGNIEVTLWRKLELNGPVQDIPLLWSSEGYRFGRKLTYF